MRKSFSTKMGYRYVTKKTLTQGAEEFRHELNNRQKLPVSDFLHELD